MEECNSGYTSAEDPSCHACKVAAALRLSFQLAAGIPTELPDGFWPCLLLVSNSRSRLKPKMLVSCEGLISEEFMFNVALVLVGVEMGAGSGR